MSYAATYMAPTLRTSELRTCNRTILVHRLDAPYASARSPVLRRVCNTHVLWLLFLLLALSYCCCCCCWCCCCCRCCGCRCGCCLFVVVVAAAVVVVTSISCPGAFLTVPSYLTASGQVVAISENPSFIRVKDTQCEMHPQHHV